MRRNESRSKHGKPQKLIIPKGTLDFNDTAVIEIPSQYRNQEVVIAKKSNISTYSRMDEGVGTSSSQRSLYQPSAYQSSAYQSSAYQSSAYQPSVYQPNIRSSGCDRLNDSAFSQTPFDERDIEKLMQDLEAYYHAQKNFLLQSSSLLKRRGEQSSTCPNSKPSSCGCDQTNSNISTPGTPATVFLLQKSLFQENTPSCSAENFRPARIPESQSFNQSCNNRTWTGNESYKTNTSRSYYEPDSSMSRNTTYPFPPNTSNQQTYISPNQPPINDSYRSQSGNRSAQVIAHDSNYDLFRDEASRAMDSSKSPGTTFTAGTSTPTKYDRSNPPPSRSILKPTNMDESLDDSEMYRSYPR